MRSIIFPANVKEGKRRELPDGIPSGERLKVSYQSFDRELSAKKRIASVNKRTSFENIVIEITVTRRLIISFRVSTINLKCTDGSIPQEHVPIWQVGYYVKQIAYL